MPDLDVRIEALPPLQTATPLHQYSRRKERR